MTDQPLVGKTVAILVASGFEELEMTEPQRALLQAGAQVKVVSSDQAIVNGWHGDAWGHYFTIDVPLSNALAADFDAVIVPGGSRSVDKLLSLAHTARFLRGFLDGGKPVALGGLAGGLLATVDRAKGRNIAATPETTDALVEAGATLVEEPVAIDGNLVTASTTAEAEAFKDATVKLLMEQLSQMADAA